MQNDNHLYLGALESRAANHPHPWDRWIARAAEIAGHDLDGSQDLDGYCLDYAYEAFEHGESPESYVERTNAVNRPSLKD